MCNFSCSILDNDPASLGLGKQKERSKEHVKKILKNFSYTFVSNVVSFCISALVTFIVPKKLGVESYGYFQLYLFYVSYVGFSTLAGQMVSFYVTVERITINWTVQNLAHSFGFTVRLN